MSTKLSMRQFRIEVFKGVFLMEFHDEEGITAQLDDMYDPDTSLDEIKISEADSTAITDKCKAIIDSSTQLDQIISDNLDKWTINRIGKVELTILRVAIYEYKIEGLDAAIAINEAVDIAKIYGGDKSGAFINGVMAKVVSKDSD